MSNAESARVTTFVDVSPDDAFEAFTEEIDIWWRRGPRYRNGGGGTSELCFELDAAGRRLVERMAGDVFEIGRVRVWEPGKRLVFEWRVRNFAPGESTEVELRFEASGDGTRVTLEHRGWDSIREGHPVRHGLHGDAFASMIGRYWGDLVTVYRLYTSARRSVCST
jgi:activator of HSP90 ATPase